MQHVIRNIRSKQIMRQKHAQTKHTPTSKRVGAISQTAPVDPFRTNPQHLGYVADPHQVAPMMLGAVDTQDHQQVFRTKIWYRSAMHRNSLDIIPQGSGIEREIEGL